MTCSRAAAPVLLVAALAASLLAGCAQDTIAYPSLAPRATEKRGFDEPDVPAPAPAVADPALDARLQPLATQLDAIAQGFARDEARAGAAAGAAGSHVVGTEGWIAAQTALAALDDWRSQASSLATDLDTLGGERAATAGTAYPPLEALRARATAEAEREATAIATTGARLPSP